MKNENYITILGWMINDMKLQGNELVIYAVIHGFSQDGESEFRGANKYLEEASNCTRNTVKACLKKLEEKGFIKRTIIELNNVKFNTFKALQLGGSEIDPPYQNLCEECQEVTCECQNLTKGGQKLTEGGSEIDPNITINNNTKDITKDILSKQMSEIEISDFATEEEKKYFQVALAFQLLFIKNLENKKISAKKIKEARGKDMIPSIRLMFEKDECTDEQFRDVYKYLQSPAGDFWTANILSTTKLRKQFTTLILQYGRQKPITQDNRSAAEKTESAIRNRFSHVTEGTEES